MKKSRLHKILFCLILAFSFSCISIISAFAHSGDTDSSGGHIDSSTGKYHYHCGGNPAHQHTNGRCPYGGYSGSSNNSFFSGGSSLSGNKNSSSSSSSDDVNIVWIIIGAVVIIGLIYWLALRFTSTTNSSSSSKSTTNPSCEQPQSSAKNPPQPDLNVSQALSPPKIKSPLPPSENKPTVENNIDSLRDELMKERQELRSKILAAEKALIDAKAEAINIISNAQKEAEEILRKNEAAERQFEKATNLRIEVCDDLKTQFDKQCQYSLMYKRILDGKLSKVFETDLEIAGLSQISADIRSGDHVYKNVTLNSCPCDDFKFSHFQPCKHMLYLAYNLGVLQIARVEQKATFEKVQRMVEDTKQKNKQSSKTTKRN